MTTQHFVSNPTFEGFLAVTRIPAFMRAVYGWMSIGLILTATMAWLVAHSTMFSTAIATNMFLFWGLAIAQIGLVIFLSARIDRLATSTAAVLFIAYSALTGVTLSVLLLAYTGQSIATTFLVSAGMFGGMAVYGATTRRSLRGAAQFLFMGLIGVVLASVVGLFWHSGGLQFILALAGVVVFAGLAAYDAQRLGAMALTVPDAYVGTYAVSGALALYLDFVNLFLSLLRLSGRRRS